jgi:hypothetical protein
MSKCVRIHGDMNIWTLKENLSPGQLTDPAQPQELSVTKPVNGILLLSVRAAASIILLPDGAVDPMVGCDPMGWIPGDVVPVPYLYLPSGTVSAAEQNRYPLAKNVDTGRLQSQIKAAMAADPGLTVSVDVAGRGSAVVLNCATLPFVVIAGPPS